MTSITKHSLAAADPYEISSLLNDLVVERMRLDKEFSEFLDSVDLDELEVTAEEWAQYRSKLAQYGHNNELILAAKYYMGKYGIQ